MLDAPCGPKVLDLADPVDRGHPLNRDRLSWWIVLPPWAGGGTWFDLLGRASGTLTAGPVWGSASRPGGWGSLELNGSNYVDTGSRVGPAAGFSLFAWVKPAGTAVQIYVGHYSGASNAYTQVYQTTSWFARLHGSGTYVGRSGGTVETGAWQRVGFTWDGGTTNASIRVYKNGFQVDSADDGSGVFTGANPNSLPFLIGKQADGANFTGSLDDVSTWARTLSSEEAWQDYDLSRRGYPQGLNWYVPGLWSLPPPVGGPGTATPPALSLASSPQAPAATGAALTAPTALAPVTFPAAPLVTGQGLAIVPAVAMTSAAPAPAGLGAALAAPPGANLLAGPLSPAVQGVGLALPAALTARLLALSPTPPLLPSLRVVPLVGRRQTATGLTGRRETTDPLKGGLG